MIGRALLGLAIAVTACRSDAPAPRESTPVLGLPHQQAPRILDPGPAPRARLRYALAAGEHLVTLESHVTARALEGATWSPPRALPAIRTGVAITPGPTGSLRVRALEGPAPGAWALVGGRTFELATDDQGRHRGLALADGAIGAPAAVDELGQRWLALRVPFPAEPVGLGASWRVVTILRQRPAVVKQTATYTLRGRTATRWSIEVELARVAEPQVAIDPAVPPGTVVDVVALVTRISGTVDVDPTRALPTGQLATSSTLHLRLRTQGGVTEQIYDDTSTVRIGPP